MTISKKSKIILAAVAAVIIAVGGGMFYMQHQEHEKMVAIATSPEAKKVYEEYLRMEDPKALTKDGIVKSYEVDTDDLQYNPMGGLMTRIYINGNKEMTMSFNLLDNEDGTYSTAYYLMSGELSKLLEK